VDMYQQKLLAPALLLIQNKTSENLFLTQWTKQV